MKKKTTIILTILFLTCNCYSQDTINGEFEYNKILNEYIDLNKNAQEKFKKGLTELNYTLIEQYLTLLTENQFAKADSVLKADKKLKDMPTRAISLCYSLNQVNKFGLLDFPCISLTNMDMNGTKTIYLTKKQLKKIRHSLGKPQTFKVEYIGEATLTKFKIYKLIDN